MNNIHLSKTLKLISLLVLGGLSLAACKQNTPTENANEQTDATYELMNDSVSSGMDNMRESTAKMADDTSETLNTVTEQASDTIERGVDTIKEGTTEMMHSTQEAMDN